MAFWHKKEKRLKRKQQRQLKRVKNKRKRADRARKRGNTSRCNRLTNRANHLEKKAMGIVFWERCIFQSSRNYSITEEDIKLLKSGINLCRKQALNIKCDLNELDTASDSAVEGIWRTKSNFIESFGLEADQKQIRKVIRVVKVINNVLLNQQIMIKLVKDSKDYSAITAPGILNRPFSKNFQFRINMSMNPSENILNDTGRFN